MDQSTKAFTVVIFLLFILLMFYVNENIALKAEFNSKKFPETLKSTAATCLETGNAGLGSSTRPPPAPNQDPILVSRLEPPSKQQLMLEPSIEILPDATPNQKHSSGFIEELRQAKARESFSSNSVSKQGEQNGAFLNAIKAAHSASLKNKAKDTPLQTNSPFTSSGQ